MKNYRSIVFRYFREKKGRTLLTIFGIIISIAMITAVGTLIVSVQETMVQQAIKEGGNWHGEFGAIDKNKLNILKNHIEIEEVGISQYEGAVNMGEIPEQELRNIKDGMDNRYLDIYSYDEKGFNMRAISLLEGRFPENSNEIIIEENSLKKFNKEVKVDSILNLDILEGVNWEEDGKAEEKSFKYKKQYKVVGIVKSQAKWSGQFSFIAYNGLSENDLRENEFSGIVQLKSTKNANDKINEIAGKIDYEEENIITNYKLLRLYAESFDMNLNVALRNLLIFIVLLIMICTIAVIYNSFNISVLERISEFGILRSVGATPKQIRGIVFLEAMILFFISLPLGILSGFIGIKIVFWVLGKLGSNLYIINNLKLLISPIVLGITTFLSFITVIVSAWIPARKAGNISPMDAIRNTGQIKKENIKKVKDYRFIRKIFGIEGEIARKNINRNKGRFIITVFSMVISIVLFIVFSSFSNYTKEITGLMDESIGDFMIYNRGEIDDALMEKDIKSIEGIESYYRIHQKYGNSIVDKNKIKKNYLEEYKDNNPVKILKDGKASVDFTQVMTLGNENLEVLKSKLLDGEISIDKMNREKGVLLINTTNVSEATGNVEVDAYDFKVGDTIKFKEHGAESSEDKIEEVELKVLGVISEGILEDTKNASGAYSMITTDEIFNSIFKEIKDTKIYVQMDKTSDLKPMQDYLEEINLEYGLHYIDYAEMAREQRAMHITMSIFLYGFVTLIALISSINIINTISTNIMLRTREISILKAVGMDIKGIKKMVGLESVFYSLYAALFGSILGIGLSYGLYKIMVGIGTLDYIIPFKEAIFAGAGALIIALISGGLPVRKINNNIIIENIKREG